jgi:hypothetical protein
MARAKESAVGKNQDPPVPGLKSAATSERPRLPIPEGSLQHRSPVADAWRLSSSTCFAPSFSLRLRTVHCGKPDAPRHRPRVNPWPLALDHLKPTRWGRELTCRLNPRAPEGSFVARHS